MPSTHLVSLSLLGPAISEEIGFTQRDSQCTYLQRLTALAFGSSLNQITVASSVYPKMPLLPYDYLHLVNCPEVVTISDSYDVTLELERLGQ